MDKEILADLIPSEKNGYEKFLDGYTEIEQNVPSLLHRAVKVCQNPITGQLDLDVWENLPVELLKHVKDAAEKEFNFAAIDNATLCAIDNYIYSYLMKLYNAGILRKNLVDNEWEVTGELSDMDRQ